MPVSLKGPKTINHTGFLTQLPTAKLNMSRYLKNLGDWGEKIAVTFLKQRGYTIINQNFSSTYGEIDIIALHPYYKNTIYCIEVKTRLTINFGQPEEAITPNKIKRLHDTACSYFFKHQIENKIFRLDVISILINPHTKKAKIKHLKGLGYEDLNV